MKPVTRLMALLVLLGALVWPAFAAPGLPLVLPKDIEGREIRVREDARAIDRPGVSESHPLPPLTPEGPSIR